MWKQIEKKQLQVASRVDDGRIRQLAADLTEETLGRRLFELAAAAKARGLDPEAALRHETSRIVQAAETAWFAANPPSSS